MMNQSARDYAHTLATTWHTAPLDDQQRACLANVLAKLCLPTDMPLIFDVVQVLEVKAERLYLMVTSGFAEFLTRWSNTGTDADRYADEGTPTAAIHQDLLAWIGSHGHPGSGSYTLRSYRERVTHNSLQVVLAQAEGYYAVYADVDIDLGGARTDVVGFFTHMGELASHKPTDHVALQAKLAQDPEIAPYLAALTTNIS